MQERIYHINNMNVDKFSNRSNETSSEILSKYFNKGEAMDESLSEFQEKKKNNAGPKSQSKPKRKPKKKPKGQKDIRNLMKPKKNELISYSKDFDGICKQSGIDIDSEELQLAIALSKSLQENESTQNVCKETSKPMTSQERTKVIRATLQEYGFKASKGINSGRSLGKKTKKYKLLTISNEEKEQIIYDKYAEVLSSQGSYKSIPIQVDNSQSLIEKSPNFSLLKDWSKIPGRPVSPVFEGPYISFVDMECSSKDLDHILSGTIKSTQEIIWEKVLGNNLSSQNQLMEELSKESEKNACNLKINTNDGILPLSNSTLMTSQNRSNSPDLFDDEVTLIMDSNKSERLFDDNSIQITTSIDLTQNVNTCISMKPHFTDLSEFKINNNLVNITDCAYESENIKIDLTQSFDSKRNSNGADEQMEQCISKNININCQTNEPSNLINTQVIFNNCSTDKTILFDLSQSSNSSDDLPEIKMNLNTNKSSEDTIIVPDDFSIPKHKKSFENLTNSSKIFDLTTCLNDLKAVHEQESKFNKYCLNNTTTESLEADKRSTDLTSVDFDVNNDLNAVNNKHSENSATLLNTDKEIHTESKIVANNINNESLLDILDSNEESTSETEECDRIVITNSSDDCSVDGQNIDESNVFGHCSYTIEETKNNKNNLVQYKKNDITNSSNDNSVDGLNIDANNDFELGNDYVSINYDDNDLGIENYNPCSSESTIAIDLNISKYTPNTKKYSGSFNCSLKPQENYDYVGTSIMELTDSNKINYDRSLNRSLSDSFLPLVEVRGRDRPTQSQNMVSDERQCGTFGQESDYDIVKTPCDKEYIIKTDCVTPMRDYESMSSPERNMELERYGLKPFRRKRAIQLLTYIYDQTHPIMDASNQASPSKRRKVSASISPMKHQSPVKVIQELNINNMENIYVETNTLPLIKEIACSPDDWVFQTREKAKVQSCRLPLHVAFHNYVTCRRRLQDAILSYEPIDIDCVHKQLVASGYRYNPKDLLKFMDKKCITVKTAEKNNRNRR
ncbi:unnamed protein product [Leptidea sinapis]|uniref:Structure-specific endonuclease subunit SLX4 n=1 Tax=Leptidea sinapis TaxID=189913 RepID=A0A5E4PP75_9NEOP|nr:unnamed protein product [Leptidea sinapis]